VNARYSGSKATKNTILISPYKIFRMVQMDTVVSLKNSSILIWNLMFGVETNDLVFNVVDVIF